MLRQLSKYIPLTASNWQGLVALEIIEDVNQLKFKISLLHVRQSPLFNNIKKELERNMSNRNMVDVLDKEIVVAQEFTQLQALDFKDSLEIEMNKFLGGNNIGSDNVNIVGVGGLRNFSIPHDKAYIVWRTISYFVDNYQLLLSKTITEEPKAPIVEVDEIAATIEEHKEDGIFASILGIMDCPHIVKVFLSKQILVRDLSVFIKIEDKKLTIHHKPVYDFDFWKHTEHYTSAVLTLLENLSETDVISISFKLKTLARQLLYLINNKGDLTPNDSTQKEWDITVVCLLSLFYLYSLKMVESKFMNHVYSKNIKSGNNYLGMLNNGMKYVFDKFKLRGDVESIDIRFYDEETKTNELELDLQGIIQQYQYLNAIDHNSFKQAVFDDFMVDRKKPSVAPPTMSISNPTIISIDRFIKAKDEAEKYNHISMFKLTPKFNMDYYELSLVDGKKIISYPLLKLLAIQSDGTLTMHLDDTSPLRLWMDIILNNIFKDIQTKQRFMAENVTSVFQIYEFFIVPYIKDRYIGEKNIQFLIYQVIIPLLYYEFGTNKIVDNFH